MSSSFKMYMEDIVQPMREELTNIGIKEMLTPEEVDEGLELAKDGTALIVINSVCGCAAGLCRPGVAQALQNDAVPDHWFTVFAGQEREATARLREYLEPYPPSSPSIALMKEGKLVHFIERHGIENRSAEEISAELVSAFDHYCK